MYSHRCTDLDTHTDVHVPVPPVTPHMLTYICQEQPCTYHPPNRCSSRYSHMHTHNYTYKRVASSTQVYPPPTPVYPPIQTYHNSTQPPLKSLTIHTQPLTLTPSTGKHLCPDAISASNPHGLLIQTMHTPSQSAPPTDLHAPTHSLRPGACLLLWEPTEAHLGELWWLSDLQGLEEVLPLRDPAMTEASAVHCPSCPLSVFTPGR